MVLQLGERERKKKMMALDQKIDLISNPCLFLRQRKSMKHFVKMFYK